MNELTILYSDYCFILKSHHTTHNFFYFFINLGSTKHRSCSHKNFCNCNSFLHYLSVCIVGQTIQNTHQEEDYFKQEFTTPTPLMKKVKKNCFDWFWKKELLFFASFIILIFNDSLLLTLTLPDINEQTKMAVLPKSPSVKNLSFHTLKDKR